MDTLYTFWDNITHYETKSVHFLGLMNSATKNVEQTPQKLTGKDVGPEFTYGSFRNRGP